MSEHEGATTLPTRPAPAGHAVEALREQAAELGDRVERKVRRARLGFWQLMEERPLAVGAVALALGLLAGLALPSTESEDSLMGEARDRLLDRARHGARGLLDP